MARIPDLDEFLDDDSEWPDDEMPVDDWEWGYVAGEKSEQDRIIKLLEPLAEHEDYCKDGCYAEDCSAPSYRYAIDLIKGEQK